MALQFGYATGGGEPGAVHIPGGTAHVISTTPALTASFNARASPAPADVRSIDGGAAHAATTVNGASRANGAARAERTACTTVGAATAAEPGPKNQCENQS